MNDLKQPYRDLLGLNDSWNVNELDLDLTGNRLVINLSFSGADLGYPECGVGGSRAATAPSSPGRSPPPMDESIEPDKPSQPGDQLLPLVYQELRQLAAARIRQEPAGQTLQATALVHEVYLRLLKSSDRWESKGHFFSAAATAMRRILIENARRKARIKHGGEWQRVELAELFIGETSSHERLVELDDALTRLAELDRFAARVAELRLFAGLTIAELAETLEMPQTSVVREWAFARAWLKSHLSDGKSSLS